MAEQLALLDREESDFRLDPHTRQIGKAGVAQARQALAAVVQAAAERADRDRSAESDRVAA